MGVSISGDSEHLLGAFGTRGAGSSAGRTWMTCWQTRAGRGLWNRTALRAGETAWWRLSSWGQEAACDAHIPPRLLLGLGAPCPVRLWGGERVCRGSSRNFLGAWLALNFPFLYGGNHSISWVNLPCGVRHPSGIPGLRIPSSPGLRVSAALGQDCSWAHPYRPLTLNVADLWLLPEAS